MSTDFRGRDPKGLPLVSIVAVSYNHERFLEETLDSIKAQTYPNIQLIIMDDCSQDNSVAKIEQWIEKNKVNCKFIPHKQNVGICKTLNEGLEYCNGEYFLAISCDDIILINKLELQVKEFIKCNDNDVMVIFSNEIFIDENGNALQQQREKFYHKQFIDYSDYFDENFMSSQMAPASILYKKEIFDLIGKYDEDLLFEDWDLHLRILKKYKIKYFKYVSCKHRIVKSSFTQTLFSSNWFYYTIFRVLSKHVNNELIGSERIDKAFKSSIKGLYVLDHRFYWFRIIIGNKFSLYVLFHFILSILGFTYHQGVRISEILGVFIPVIGINDKKK